METDGENSIKLAGMLSYGIALIKSQYVSSPKWNYEVLVDKSGNMLQMQH